jgi:hypothetical protein
MDGFGLDDLAEDSDEEEGGRKKPRDEESGLRQSGNPAARLSGSGRIRQTVEKETVRPSKGAGRGE